MAEPLSSERLEWIRRCNREDKARHGGTWEDHGEPAERHRDELLAEVDRLRAGIVALDRLKVENATLRTALREAEDL